MGLQVSGYIIYETDEKLERQHVIWHNVINDNTELSPSAVYIVCVRVYCVCSVQVPYMAVASRHYHIAI